MAYSRTHGMFALLCMSQGDKAAVEDGGGNYKSSQQFADHLKGRSQAVSAFAKSKTLKEQREFLPIFAIRQQVW